MDIKDLKLEYEKYKEDKSKYEKEVYLKESKESEIKDKILLSFNQLRKLNIKGLNLDENRLNDKDYLIELLNSVKTKMDTLIGETDDLLKSR